MKRSQFLLLAFFSGFLLSLPWLDILPGWILFVAFLPLLVIEDQLFLQRNTKHGIVFFGYAYLSFFIWNLLTTWWIMHATILGMLVIVVLNSGLMSVVWWLYHLFKRKVGVRLAGLLFVVLWLSFEYIHFNWEIAWPWLTLGNGFANHVKLVQWYDVTGVLGGSLWVLLVNYLFFKIYKSISLAERRIQIVRYIVLLIVIFAPIIYSFIRYYHYQEEGEELEVVILQPNVDPYTEKFDGISAREQVDRLLLLADSLVSNSTDYLVGPETAIPSVLDDERIAQNPYILPFRRLALQYPKLKIVLGATTQKLFRLGEETPEAVRKMKDEDLYSDVYNSAIQIDQSEKVQCYHKSILVNGVEKMPFSRYFSFVEKFIIDLGGTTGSLGKQDDPSVFQGYNDVQVAPVICYESVFGEYLSEFVKKGANLFFIITNDGWWLDTPGYKQHFSFSRLRAIETRRSIARSANTGISAIINQRGDVVLQTQWWEKSAIKGNLTANLGKTFYVRYRDYIGRISTFIGALLLLYLLVQTMIFKNKKNPH